MYESKLFKTGIGILLLFLIIFIGVQIQFVFMPIVVIFEALFVSFLVAGILFYFTAPLSDFFCRRRVPRPLSILLVFLVIASLFSLFGIVAGPILAEEAARLIDGIPDKTRQMQTLLMNFKDHPLLGRLGDLEVFNLDRITESIGSLAAGSVTGLAAGLSGLLDFLGSLFTAIVIVPFLLYYMLKERGSGLIEGVVERFAPLEYRESIKNALAELNGTLSAYFQGVGLVCLLVGVMAYIGFLIIGLDYALILAVFILVTNIVPFIGPWIGALPAAFVGLLTSPLLLLKVIIVIVVVQQIESLFITPQIMGRRVSLSPLAIILVILIAGRLAGLLGIIIAVPAFTVLKIVINHVYHHIRNARKSGEA